MYQKCLPVLLLVAASVCPGQQPKSAPAKSPPPAAATATGTFVGRSGKPMAGARVMLAEVQKDEDVLYARLKLLPATAGVCDAQGRFTLKGFAPGNYAIVYQPAGGTTVLPIQIPIKSLLAVDRSTMPMLRNVEVPKAEKDRAWGGVTLLKGHTFLSQGEFMKIWNATAKRSPAGPHMEIRKGLIVTERLDDKSQLKLEAWSF